MCALTFFYPTTCHASWHASLPHHSVCPTLPPFLQPYLLPTLPISYPCPLYYPTHWFSPTQLPWFLPSSPSLVYLPVTLFAILPSSLPVIPLILIPSDPGLTVTWPAKEDDLDYLGEGSWRRRRRRRGLRMDSSPLWFLTIPSKMHMEANNLPYLYLFPYSFVPYALCYGDGVHHACAYHMPSVIELWCLCAVHGFCVPSLCATATLLLPTTFLPPPCVLPRGLLPTVLWCPMLDWWVVCAMPYTFPTCRSVPSLPPPCLPAYHHHHLPHTTTAPSPTPTYPLPPHLPHAPTAFWVLV